MSSRSSKHHDFERADSGFLREGGEMGQRMRELDWSSSRLGTPNRWPQSLKAAIRILLNSRYPMFVWWGHERINFYNDAYIPVLGKRHPYALGRPAPDIWADIWPVVGPLSDAVLEEGRATWNEELLLLMERNQFLEETYFTFSYSPIPGDEGGVSGVFCACTEETHRVLNRRRLRTLRELAERAGEVKTAEDACEISARTLAENPHDLPFLLLYLLNGEGAAARATLAGAAGLGPDGPASPPLIDVGSAKAPWPFWRVVETGKPVEVGQLIEKFGALPGGPWPESPKQALVLPMAKPGQVQLAGFVVAGVSPRLALTGEYQAFLELVAGQVAGAVANARAYEEERRRAEALAELDRAKTAFFSNVSHELRTPLTLMLGPLEEMLAGSATDRIRAEKSQLQLVHRNGLRLLKLVNTMLDFSRIEAGRIRAHYEPVDLAAHTAELASVFRAAVEQAGLGLIVDCPPLPEPVYVDRDMWEKIVLNLLSNAFKFTLEGEIEVRLEAVGGEARLTVRDTGVGIPAAEIPRIFDRFHRVADSRGRTYEGAGIGLALAHELVKLHGGSVRAESVLNEGSRFVVRLPFGKAHLDPRHVQSSSATTTKTGAEAFLDEALRWLPGAEEGYLEENAWMRAEGEAIGLAAAEESSESSAPRARILLVDDNADMREYLRRLLGTRFDVATAADGRAALETARAHPPSLVLADVMMPKLDGFGLLKELRADLRLCEIPVVLLSARAGEEARVEGMERGADDYLVKPFSGRELLARVEAHVKMAEVRREADRVVRESEAKLQRIVANAPIAIAVLKGEELELVSVNPACQSILGAEVPLVGRTLGEAFPEAAELGAEQALRHVLHTGRSWKIRDFETRIPGRAGKTWWEGEALPLPSEGGKTDSLLVLGWEISQRKEAELHLRESEERFRAIFNAAGVSVWVEDFTRVKAALDDLRREGVSDFRAYLADHPEFLRRAIDLVRIVDVNSESLKMFGAESKEALLGSLHDVFTSESEAVFAEELLALAEGREALEMEAPLRALDGRPLVVLLTATFGPRTADYGRVVVTLTDITLRKQAESTLRESEQRFKSMADSAPAMLWLTDAGHRCTFLSRGWYAHTGQEEGDGLGQGWLEAIHPDDRTRVEESFLEAAEKREPFSLDYRLRTAGGEYRWAMDMARPRLGPDGEFLGFIGSVVDTHERRKAQELLARTNETLEQRVLERTAELEAVTDRLRLLASALTEAEQRERRRLAAVLHDHLQQLLVAAKMRLDNLSGSCTDESDVAEATRIAELLDDSLKASRSLTEELRPPALYEGGLLAGLRWLSGWMEETHGLKVHLEADPSVESIGEKGGVLLFESVRELLLNVVKYARCEAAWVILEPASEGEISMAVRDEGAGFDPAQGLRADRAGGLGLFSIRERLQVLGGRLEILTTPGEGTTVKLFAPLSALVEKGPPKSDPVLANGAADSGEDAADPEARIRVLLADDHEIVRQGIASLLENAGDMVVVAEADDGLQALHAARTFRPDVAVLDVNMPNMNGIEATQAILSAVPGVQIVGLSVQVDGGTRQAMLEAGARAYLAKGGPAEKLIDTIRALAKSRSTQVGARSPGSV